MHLFLVRHGETVDNVAQVIAGSRDSPLTNHGFEQARRLGAHLHARDLDFSHVFASPLQRARITAEQILVPKDAAHRDQVKFVIVEELQEKDFGIYEGAGWGDIPSTGSERETIETEANHLLRLNAFLDTHLSPLFAAEDEALRHSRLVSEPVVAIVSHGMTLHTLWPQILAWLKPVHINCPHGLLIGSGCDDYIQLGSWSNTAFLEARIRPSLNIPPPDHTETELAAVGLEGTVTQPPTPQAKYNVDILALNYKPHLSSLYRTKGGIGSAKYDPRQSSIDGFFK